MLLVVGTTTTVSAFTPLQTTKSIISTSSLNMGLFDGVKEAFSAPPSSQIDSERETPIDRWMGWSVVSDAAPEEENSKVDAGE